MATPNKFAIREVALATFYDIATGKAVLHLDTLKTSGIENTAETVYAQGGRGNSRLVGFSGSREASITLQDAVFDNEAIAMMTGNGLTEGSVSIHKRDVITTESGGTATLKATPVDGVLISLYELNPDGSHRQEFTEVTDAPMDNEYSISGNTLTFDSSIETGKQLVAYYMAETADDAKTIHVTSDSFAGSFKLVLDCLVRDLHTKNDYAAQIIVPNCKAEDDWSFELAADGDPSALDIPLQVLRDPASNRFWEMVVFDETLV